MKTTFNDKLIAYLTLFSGLAISGVAEYYSIMGLIAIYPAVFWPIVVMGVVLGIGKITGTVWVKQNWELAPFFLKAYILPAIIVLMIITSLGVFGFLSKAHSDQSLVSGDVQSKIAIYDEKIKTAKENIEANRRQLKQMDEAVDQVMARSSDEKGADKANAIRRSQQKDRVALAKDIEANQKLIASLNDEAAPIRAEVRKVEAEVGPVKYIAHLLYGENPDANILEKAVIWVTVLIVTVLDPLAVILLLASQYSFQQFKKNDEDETPDPYVADVGEKPTEEEKVSINDVVPQPQEYIADKDDLFPTYEEITPSEQSLEDINFELAEAVDKEEQEWNEWQEDGSIPVEPELVAELAPVEDTAHKRTRISGSRKELPEVKTFKAPEIMTEVTEEKVQQELEEPVKVLSEEDTRHHSNDYITINGQTYRAGGKPTKVETSLYVQNEEQNESGLWTKTKSDKE